MVMKYNKHKGSFEFKYCLDEPRVCTRCKENKDASSFNIRKLESGNLSRTSRCKPCLAQITKERVARLSPEERERKNNKTKEYHSNNLDKLVRHNRNSALKRGFNITVEDYNKMLKEQNNLCAICKKPETDIVKNTRVPRPKNLSIDHCHTTGKVRQLLCGKCNKGLGHFKDNPETMLAAIEYLRRHQ